ncbi:MAG: globin [Betaproteobacteria bacterium]|nr:MAG: globin [Betaproteobacteria bacterium]
MTTQAAPDAQAATPFARLGGEEGVRALVDRFYDLMDLEPEFAPLRAVHGASLAHARDKLHLFLCGWLGGPPLYASRYGHPRLRSRHLPFPIGARERDQWVACMARALDDAGGPDDLKAPLMEAFAGTADWMVNR